MGMAGASKDFVLGPVRMPRVLAFLIGAILIVSVAAAVTARNAAVLGSCAERSGAS
jgi:ABC-type enterobactin transport system permease subunit